MGSSFPSVSEPGCLFCGENLYILSCVSQKVLAASKNKLCMNTYYSPMRSEYASDWLAEDLKGVESAEWAAIADLWVCVPVVLLFFGVCMLLNRFEVGISREGSTIQSHSLTMEKITELEKILHDRKVILNHILGGIEAAYATRTLTQPTAIKAAADKQILETSKQVNIGLVHHRSI